MPHCRPEDLRSAKDRWPCVGEDSYKCEHWGDMEIALTTLPGPLDATQNYIDGGSAGGVCPCPHYGYVFEGTMRASYPGTGRPDEVVKAGEVYYIPAGHILSYDEASKVLELNPAAALKDCMDAMQRAADKRAAAAAES